MMPYLLGLSMHKAPALTYPPSSPHPPAFDAGACAGMMWSDGCQGGTPTQQPQHVKCTNQSDPTRPEGHVPPAPLAPSLPSPPPTWHACNHESVPPAGAATH